MTLEQWPGLLWLVSFTLSAKIDTYILGKTTEKISKAFGLAALQLQRVLAYKE